MKDRLLLHNKLLEYVDNVYFQPPSNIQLKYPCIVYNKTGKSRKYSNNGIYMVKQEYKLTVIDRDPDSDLADMIEAQSPFAKITQYYTMDNLNHQVVNLYY